MQHSARPQKILLVGLYEDANLGDRIIFDCAKQLLEKQGCLEFDKLNLSPRLNFFERGICILCALFAGERQAYRLLSRFYSRLFVSSVAKAGKVVFAGGGIVKWSYQFFWAQIASVVRLAEKYGAHVYFNAVGVEGYDENNFRCKILKQALNSPCVRLVSTRDDIGILTSLYLSGSSIKTSRVADPAVFAGRVYGITRQPSDTIGVGLIRKDIFTDNLVAFPAEKVMALYVSFIHLLQSKGYGVELFTNGMPKDLELASQICKECGLNESDIKSPHEAKDLVHVISHYKCVVAGRLHACIVSYSLGIPAVGIVWNDKLKMFGENIGFPERFVGVADLNAENLLYQMEEALVKGYDEESRLPFEQTEIRCIWEIVHD